MKNVMLTTGTTTTMTKTIMATLSTIIMLSSATNSSAEVLSCASARKQQAAFLNRNPDNKAQNDDGYSAAPEAYKTIQSFDTSRPANRISLFSCVVGLGAAALMWDGEEIAGYFADKLKDPVLRKVYNDELAAFPDKCRASLLRDSVDARRCYDGLPKEPTPEQEAACEKNFSDKSNFRTCPARSPSAKTEKKSK